MAEDPKKKKDEKGKQAQLVDQIAAINEESNKEKEKAAETPLGAQLKGVSAAEAQGRKEKQFGTEAGKRAIANEAAANAVARDKFTMEVDTPEKRAAKWAKDNGINFGLGGAPRYYAKIKEGKSPEQAARELGLYK